MSSSPLSLPAAQSWNSLTSSSAVCIIYTSPLFLRAVQHLAGIAAGLEEDKASFPGSLGQPVAEPKLEYEPPVFGLRDHVGSGNCTEAGKAPRQPVPASFQQGCLLFVYLEGIALLQG